MDWPIADTYLEHAKGMLESKHRHRIYYVETHLFGKYLEYEGLKEDISDLSPNNQVNFILLVALAEGEKL